MLRPKSKLMITKGGDIMAATKIYLQIKDDSGEDQDEVTWCEDRIEDTDIVYIRADIPDE